MSRHSKPDFLDIINEYPWDNMQKHIVGEAIRQFVVNILDSTAEMLLLDGRTIEEAIAMLRSAQDAINAKIASLENKSAQQDSKISALQQAVTALQQAVEQLKNITPEPGGSTLAFSDQFKKINEVVHLNLKWVTAQEEPVPSIYMTPNVDIVSPPYPMSYSYDPELDEHRFETLEDLSPRGEGGFSRIVHPANLLTDAEHQDLDDSLGNIIIITFDLKVNQVLYDSIPVSSDGDRHIYVSTDYGATSLGVIPGVDEFSKMGRENRMFIAPMSSIRLAFSYRIADAENRFMPVGSVFTLRKVKIYKIQYNY